MEKFTILVVVSFMLFLKQATSSTSTSPVGSPATTPLPMTVVCKNATFATLYVNKGFLAGPVLPCKPVNTTQKSGTDTIYTLDKNCLKPKMFIIVPDRGNGIVQGKKYHEYQLTCNEPGGGVTEVVSVNGFVKAPTGTPVQKTATFIPSAPQLQLLLRDTDPSGPTDVAKIQDTHVVKEAYLGQDIFLTILNTESINGKPYLIPLYCDASAGRTTLSIWRLHDTNTEMKCFKEDSIIEDRFKFKNLSIKGDVAFAKMQAFQFQAESNKDITFSCHVRVCSETRADSVCSADYNDRTCSSGHVTAFRRRRRHVAHDVEEEIPSGGGLHHVTATLHVQDDVVFTGGSIRVLYTVSCLVLSVLAAISL